jgi:hypothetical protein
MYGYKSFRQCLVPNFRVEVKMESAGSSETLNIPLHAIISQKIKISVLRAVKVSSHLFFQHIKSESEFWLVSLRNAEL